MPLSEREIKELLEKAEHYLDLQSKTEEVDLLYLEKALEFYNQVIENAPLHPYYFIMRANVKMVLASRSVSYELDDAIRDTDKAIELDPDNGTYYWMRGVCLSKKLSEAQRLSEEKNISSLDRKQLLKMIVTNYKASVERDPSNAEVWLSLLESDLLLHNWDDAISTYGSCKPYMKDKEDPLVRAWLGCLALVFAGDSIEEEDKKLLHDQTIKLESDIRVSNISFFLNEIRDKEEYKEKWKKAMEIHYLLIDHIDKSNTGYELLELGLYEKALESFEEAIKRNPCSAMAWDNKGVALKRLGRYEEAFEAFDKAIELNHNLVEAWYNKACTFAVKGDKADSFKSLLKAIELQSSIRDIAKKDKDFKNLRDDEDFRRIVM